MTYYLRVQQRQAVLDNINNLPWTKRDDLALRRTSFYENIVKSFKVNNWPLNEGRRHLHSCKETLLLAIKVSSCQGTSSTSLMPSLAWWKVHKTRPLMVNQMEMIKMLAKSCLILVNQREAGDVDDPSSNSDDDTDAGRTAVNILAQQTYIGW